MKKLALLLGSLLVVGVTAQAKEVIVAPVEESKEVVVVAEPVVEEVAVVVEEAAPVLRLTGVKTYLTSENRSGSRGGNLGDNSLRLETSFAYGENWTGRFNMRRYFSSNTKDSYGEEGLFQKGDTRTYVGIQRNNIFEDYALGFTYISEKGWDKLDVAFSFAPTDYLSGYVVYEYVSNSGIASDANYVEFQPKLTWNGWGVSYYFEGEYAIENDAEYAYQQIRFFTPTYSVGNFGVSGEYRGTLSYESKDELGKDTYGVGTRMDSAFDVNRVYAHTTYKLSESTTLFADLGYEFGKWEEESNGSSDSDMVIVETGVSIKF